ncbi:MAG: ribonuclease R [Bacteroidota bacterium]
MSKKNKKRPKVKGKKLRTHELQREVLRLFKRSPKKQFNPRQVVNKLKIANNKDAVQHAIEQLVQAKALEAKDNYKYQIRRDYQVTASSKTAEGRVDLTRSGAAYIMVEGMEDDIYVSPKHVNTALNGDKVKIRWWKARGRRKPEGEIIEIIERSTESFVGIINTFSRFALVTLEGGRQPMDIMIPLDEMQGARDGDMVVVKIREWSNGRFDNPVGEITTVLGKPGSSELDMQAILINNGFNITFPEAVVAESEALDETITEAEIAKRRDFRDVLTFTIDPLTAKDFDDALSYRELENGQFEVGVHIADVTHYVPAKSQLDQEAYKRSTSVYLVDRVCPMLPEKLSNGLCSLRPNEDKLAFSAVFVFDQQFRVKRRWFGKTVIHSDRRFTYGEAQEVIETGEGNYPEELQLLNKVAKKLRERRFKAGSIDFSSEEVKFRLDEDGTPVEVYVKERKDAHMLVEDFMLLANREVAGFIGRKENARNKQIPFVYRVHDEPDPDKAMELALFAKALGFEMDVSTPQAISKAYTRLVRKAENDPGLKMLAPLAIRTMAKAVYTTNNIGHYGLGFSHYSHFTSPIRRYSDVLTHRILEQNLPKGSLYQVNGQKLEEQCKHISNQERKATDAERESIKYKQVEFISKHVGQDFAGIVNGISDYGVFVELKESHCEGMIAYDHMDQSYEMGDGRLYIRGRRTGQIIRMGDELTVRVLDTDLKRRRIELGLVELPENDGTALPLAEDKSKGRQSRSRSDNNRSKRGGKGNRRGGNGNGRGKRSKQQAK